MGQIHVFILILIFATNLFPRPTSAVRKKNPNVNIDPEFDEEAGDEKFNSNGNPCLDPDDASGDCVHVDFVEGSVEEFIPEELTAHLIAISGKYTKRIYPPRPHPIKALKRYAELPYPIPVGPSIFFCSFFLVLTSWWMRHVLTFALRHTAATLDLYPEHQDFPNLHLYALQESKREARLRREARNTWAWMAKKYILRQNDPKVNVDVFQTTWADFDVPKDVWGIVRAVLRASAWMTKKGSTDGVKNLGDQKDDKDDDGKGAKNVTFHRASVKGNEVKRLSVWLEELEFASNNRPNKKTLPTTKDDQKKSRPVEEGPPTTLHRPDAKFDHRHDKDDDKEEIMAEDNNPPEETDLDYVLIEMMDEAVGPPSR